MKLSARLAFGREAVRSAVSVAREKLESGIVFNPTSQELRRDPYPFYRRLRERDPVHRSYAADGWVLTRHADVLGVLRDSDYSADERNQTRFARMAKLMEAADIGARFDDGGESMLRMDPPHHTRLRGLVSKAFSARAVEAMRPRIEALLAEILDSRPKHGPLDLQREIGSPLPVMVIAEMLGIPKEDHVRFRAWSDDVVKLLGDGPLEAKRQGASASRELEAYFEGVCDARRLAPRDDLISALVAAEEKGDRLTRAELLSTLTLLLIAGNETTTNLIGNGTLALLRNPEQLELLRRDPSLIPNAVEELLRFDSPVQLTTRMATKHGDLAGQPVRKGMQIVLLLGAANRDPAAFEDPDRLDVRRKDVRHLSFSNGIHFCLGAQLARLEATLAFEAIVSRYPDLRLTDAPIDWRQNTILRGPVELRLET